MKNFTLTIFYEINHRFENAISLKCAANEQTNANKKSLKWNPSLWVPWWQRSHIYEMD